VTDVPANPPRRGRDEHGEYLNLRIRLDDRDRMPVYVNHLIMNYVAGEFVLSLAQVAVPAYSGDEVSKLKEMPGQVLFRGVIRPDKWIEAMASFSEQLDRLRENGLLPDSTGQIMEEDVDNAAIPD
jgi:hypothetical protein